MKVKEVNRKKMIIPNGLCDFTGRLAIPQILSLFRDFSNEHAQELHMSNKDLQSEGKIWLLARSQVWLIKRPVRGDKVSLNMWLHEPKKMSCVAEYEIKGDRELLVAGKNYWTVISHESRRPADPARFFKEDYPFKETTYSDEQPAEIDPDYRKCDYLGFYEVGMSDVNKCGFLYEYVYVRLVMNFFSKYRMALNRVKKFEMNLIQNPRVGEKIYFYYRKPAPNGAGMAIADVVVVNSRLETMMLGQLTIEGYNILQL